MKINITSDLHIEFEELEHKPSDCDMVIICGDISGKDKDTINWLNKTYKDIDIPVLFIAGNHEFYRSKEFHQTYKNLRDYEKESNIKFLQNDIYETDDIIFIGSTLWTDFGCNGDKYMGKLFSKETLNDYKKIKYHTKGSYRKLKPNDIEFEFCENYSFIKESVKNNPNKKIVIVTHHAPCGKSIPENFLNDECNPSYVSELSEFILDNPQIKLWCHGHIHSSSDYEVGSTRIVCNPKGYKDENKLFNPNLVIEI